MACGLVKKAQNVTAKQLTTSFEFVNLSSSVEGLPPSQHGSLFGMFTDPATVLESETVSAVPLLLLMRTGDQHCRS